MSQICHARYKTAKDVLDILLGSDSDRGEDDESDDLDYKDYECSGSESSGDSSDHVFFCWHTERKCTNP